MFRVVEKKNIPQQVLEIENPTALLARQLIKLSELHVLGDGGFMRTIMAPDMCR